MNNNNAHQEGDPAPAGSMRGRLLLCGPRDPRRDESTVNDSFACARRPAGRIHLEIRVPARRFMRSFKGGKKKGVDVKPGAKWLIYSLSKERRVLGDEEKINGSTNPHVHAAVCGNIRAAVLREAG